MSLHTRRAARLASVSATMLMVGSLAGGAASAAVGFGSTFVPATTCNADRTLVQSSDPVGTSYAAPHDGVITAWRFQTASSPPSLKLKVFRPAGAGSFTVIGSSEVVNPGPSTVSSYPAQISVRTGDRLGIYIASTGWCFVDTAGGYGTAVGDSAVGTTRVYASAPGAVPVAATLEADADGDGFGDETQDGCPAQSTVHGACDLTAPETRFTAGPTRTSRHKATFAFDSSEPGSTFECRIKGHNVTRIELKTYQPCSSPKRYKRLRVGRYKVFVRATDAAGNVDLTPAKVKLVVRARH